MRKISMEEIEQFLLDGRRAAEYAWDHYEELVAREKAYTLFGPENYGIGAAIPGKFISKRTRKLSKQTRRKNYMVYELDNEYKLLRTEYVRDYTTIDCIYLCFELDGIQYACPFLDKQKKYFRQEIIAIAYADKRPQYYAFLRPRSLIVQFFEYISPEKMHVSAYTYSPYGKFSMHGYPIDCNAPIGALNSPVNCGCWEEDVAYTDFSQWFEKDTSL